MALPVEMLGVADGGRDAGRPAAAALFGDEPPGRRARLGC